MDNLLFKRIAGGSVIDHPPVFSDNGDILFTIITRTDLTVCTARDGVQLSAIRAYSTKTGESMHDVEVQSKVVNIENMPDSSLTMVGCTEAGMIFTWKQKSRTIDTKVEMRFPEQHVSVKTFNIISCGNEYVGLATWTCMGGTCIQIGMFDLNTGQPRNQDHQLNMPLENGEHKVAVSRNKHNVIAVIQNCKLFVTSLKSRKSANFTNAGRELLTAVACHPVEETVAVGDVTGKIFIYHSLYKRKKDNPHTTLHHWHHNRVETVAFTSSGSLFYSGGLERVLVGWNYNDEGKSVLPRLNGSIVHIAVSSDNQQIAVSTDDNGITVVSPQFNATTVIQNFVRVSNDKTPWPRWPLGLRLDPRTGYIVLNGRLGQVQFYSPHDRTFFNLDVTMENRLSLESEKILYNTRITQSACNQDWLVTVECLNDLAHSPEVRLKFWLFDVVRKTYALNTQIENPHEGGVTALEFSSASRVDNLLCASSGIDGKVRMWSLGEREVYSESPDSENDNRATTTRKYWESTKETSYKNLDVTSLAFSSDGSTLGVGFGNALCIYDAETLRIKAVLSAPGGADGSTNKLIISNPLTNARLTKKHQESIQRREQIVRNFLENDDDQLINDLIKETEKTPRQRRNDPMTNGKSLEEKKLFEKILALNELNFCQKLELFQKMGIHIKIPADLKVDFDDYIKYSLNVESKEKHLMARSKMLLSDAKFAGHWMLQNYLMRRSEAALNGLHLKNVTFVTDAISSQKSNGLESMDIECDQQQPSSTIPNPVRKVAKIQHVVFASGDSKHLVIVCTKYRLLIWDLLTLRLQSSWKLSARFIVVDPYTSLVAVVSIYDELYIFDPSKQYALYHRKHLPRVEGVVWLPRRESRKSSLDVDWQSVSQLFFLTGNQEMLYLVPDNDEDLFADRGTTLKEVDQLESQTQFGAMIAKQVTNDATPMAGQRNMAGGLIGEPTKMSVKALTNLQTHTMAPVHCISYSFLKSLNSKDVVQSRNPTRVPNEDDDIEIVDDSETEENSEMSRTIPERVVDSTVNRLSEEDAEKKHAEFNRLFNEKPKHNFAFMVSREEWE